jgi:hypothetical protein
LHIRAQQIFIYQVQFKKDVLSEMLVAAKWRTHLVAQQELEMIPCPQQEGAPASVETPRKLPHTVALESIKNTIPGVIATNQT